MQKLGGNQAQLAGFVTLVHIISPFVASIFLFLILLCLGAINCDSYLPFKIPLPPFTKVHKCILECRSHYNNTKKEEVGYEQSNTKLLQEIEDQKIMTANSMIVESSMESSFQFFFQGLYSMPILFLAFMDSFQGPNKLTDLVNWKNVSIISSFLTFAFTSYNIRYI